MKEGKIVTISSLQEEVDILKKNIDRLTAISAFALQYIQVLGKDSNSNSLIAPSSTSYYRYDRTDQSLMCFNRPISEFPTPKLDVLYNCILNAVRIQDLVR